MAVVWTIIETFHSPEYDGQQNVIRSMSWWAHCETTIDGKTGMADKNGKVALDTSDLTTFTPYDQVTEAQALQWLYDALGPEKQKIETDLEVQVEFCLYPNQTGGVPWSA